MRAMRAYWATASMAGASMVGESVLFLLGLLLRLLRVLILLALWRTILGPAGEAGGYTTATLLTYTLIAEVFAEQLNVRTQLANTFWEGTIVNRLLQPMGFVGIFAAEMAGRWLIDFALLSVPLLALSPLLGVDPRPASLLAGLLFVASLLLAISVGLAIDFLFGGLILALEQPVWIVDRMRWAVALILSGSLLPLALLPWGLGNAFDLLPFAATASTPLRIYVGQGDPLPLMLAQVGWSIVLWPIATWLWRANRERVVGYGG